MDITDSRTAQYKHKGISQKYTLQLQNGTIHKYKEVNIKKLLSCCHWVFFNWSPLTLYTSISFTNGPSFTPSLAWRTWEDGSSYSSGNSIGESLLHAWIRWRHKSPATVSSEHHSSTNNRHLVSKWICKKSSQFLFQDKEIHSYWAGLKQIRAYTLIPSSPIMYYKWKNKLQNKNCSLIELLNKHVLVYTYMHEFVHNS